MSNPYRTQALALPNETSTRPRWRIVKQACDHRTFSHRWLLQRRVLWFWWTVDWQYDFDLCLQTYKERIKDRTQPARGTVVWDDVRGVR